MAGYAQIPRVGRQASGQGTMKPKTLDLHECKKCGNWHADDVSCQQLVELEHKMMDMWVSRRSAPTP